MSLFRKTFLRLQPEAPDYGWVHERAVYVHKDGDLCCWCSKPLLASEWKAHQISEHTEEVRIHWKHGVDRSLKKWARGMKNVRVGVPMR